MSISKATRIFHGTLSSDQVVSTESVIVHAILLAKLNSAPINVNIEIKDNAGNVYSRIHTGDVNDGGSGWNTMKWLAGNGLVIGADPSADAADMNVSVFYSQGGA